MHLEKKTIKLKIYTNVINEAFAAEAIKPGALVDIDTNGKAINHATAAGAGAASVALEDELQGKTINDAYAVDQPVQIATLRSGDECLMVLGTGQTIVVGDDLVSAGDGTVVKTTAGTDYVIGRAMEAFTTSAAGQHIKVAITS